MNGTQPQSRRSPRGQNVRRQSTQGLSHIQTGDTKLRPAQAHPERQNEPEPELERLRRAAAPVLLAPDPLDVIEAAIRESGYGGDIRPALLTYLAMSSRVLGMREGAMPVHIVLEGPPNAGKSYTVNVVKRLFPPESYVEIVAGSPRAVIYLDEELKHRVLIFGESDSLPAGEDNAAASAIRSLLQDNRVSYRVPIKNAETGEFKTVSRDIEGPTVLVTTSTRALGAQLESRLLVVDMPFDPDQRRAALTTQAALEREGAAPPDEALLTFQLYLQKQAPLMVSVPFADVLAENLPYWIPTRRFSQILSLTKTVAVLRSAQRPRDGKGRLVAQLADYETVVRLVGPYIDLEAGGPGKAVKAVVDAVSELHQETGQPVSGSAVLKRTGLPKSTCYRSIRRAVDAGWLNNADGDERDLGLTIGKPLPGAQSLAVSMEGSPAVPPDTGGGPEAEIAPIDCRGLSGMDIKKPSNPSGNESWWGRVLKWVRKPLA